MHESLIKSYIVMKYAKPMAMAAADTSTPTANPAIAAG